MSLSFPYRLHQCSDFQSPHNRVVESGLRFPQESRWTKQSFKAECDINTIMARYQSTGEMPVLNQRVPQWFDASEFDFASMQAKVLEARELFQELPSVLRDRFGNDPASFLAYVQNSANVEEMIELGLIERRRSTEPTAPAAPPLAPAATNQA